MKNFNINRSFNINKESNINERLNKNFSKKNIIKIIIRYCDSIDISNEILGIWIRSFHFACPFIGFSILLFHHKILVDLYLFFLLSCFIMFIYLNGCLLSSIEKHLCGNDINIVDIFVEMIYNNKENLNEKRYKLTLIIALIYIFIIGLIYYIRFIRF